MKAVVMAGGEGTRLRPLTINRPKPMVPVVNRPVMEHIIELLKAHGITDIIATLQYQPEVIQEYFGDGSDFGVNLAYSIEATPLGTAGSVRKIAAELDETFIVISGDALTDMDLTRLIRFHKEKDATATLALTRVENPLEYGVVITDGSGRIVRFLEKPSWSEVFSDTINTGIYVLEPEIFDIMDDGLVYDFGKDIFPGLLKSGRPLYGYVAPEYWEDIGNLGAFLKANHDALAGKVRVKIGGEEVRKGIWLGHGVEIDPTAELKGPLVIGDNAAIRGKAQIGPLSVIGATSIIDSEACISHSVLFPHNFVGAGGDLQGTVISKGVTLGGKVVIPDGTVIGDDCSLGEAVSLKGGVKLWPNKLVDAGTVVRESIVYATRTSKSVFGAVGVSGQANIEITPELAVRLGAAFGSAFKKGDTIAVSRDTHPASVMIKRALIAGLASTGVKVANLEYAPLPLARHAIRALGLQGGVFSQMDPSTPTAMTLKFLDGRGIDIDSGMERKIENLLAREDTRKVGPGDLGKVSYPSKIFDFYHSGFLEQIDATLIRRRQFRVVLDYGHGAAGQMLPTLMGDLGCQEIALNTANDPSRFAGAPEAGLANLGEMVGAIKADLGLLWDASGERIHVVDETGHSLSGQELLALFCYLTLQAKPGASVAVPVTATRVIDMIADRFGGHVVRTKTATKTLMMAATGSVSLAGDLNGAFSFPRFQPGIDGIFAMGRLLEYLALDGRSIGRLMKDLPQPQVISESLACPWEHKGKVMRELIEQTQGKHVELVDGVKVRDGDSWVVILPDPVRPLFHFYAEPGDAGGPDLLAQYRELVAKVIRTADTTEEVIA